MAKLTQENITRESVKESLLVALGGDKKISLYLGVATTVLMFPFIALIIDIMISEITSWSSALEIIFSAFTLLTMVALPCIFFGNYFLSHRRIAKIKKGMFSVKTDKVTYMTERMKRVGRNSRLIEVFEFRDCGEVEVDHTTYSYTSHGDEFYLVFIDGENKPTLTYACKIYDYNE